MTFSHDDANARLLDLVYDEASPAERAALEAHVATCAACTADLAALGDTRARLRGALEDAPVPARVHARLLEAATQAAAPVAAAASAAAVASRAAGAVAAAAPAARARAVAPSEPARPSFWQLLRSKWMLPSFATVGAVAVVVVASKIFLEPERTMQVGREFAQAPAPEPAAPPPAPQEQAKAPAEPSPDPALAPGGLHHRPPVRFGPGGIGGGALGALKSSHGGRPELSGGNLSDRLSRYGSDGLDGLRGGSSGRGVATAPAAPLPQKAAHADDLFEGSGAKAGGLADEERARGKAEAASEAAAHRRDYAPPPSGWKGGAASGAPAAAAPVAANAPTPPPPAAAPRAASTPAAQPAKRKAAGALDDGFGDSVPSAAAEADDRVEQPVASAPLAKSAPAARKKAVAVAAKPAPPAADKAVAPLEAPASKDGAREKESKQDGSSLEALTRRADQLFAARRWSDSAVAYRELLRRYPDAELASRWRQRLAQSQAMAAQEPTVPASSHKASSKSKAAPASAPAKE
jgi:hypothetical protein